MSIQMSMSISKLKSILSFNISNKIYSLRHNLFIVSIDVNVCRESL